MDQLLGSQQLSDDSWDQKIQDMKRDEWKSDLMLNLRVLDEASGSLSCTTQVGLSYDLKGRSSPEFWREKGKEWNKHFILTQVKHRVTSSYGTRTCWLYLMIFPGDTKAEVRPSWKALRGSNDV